MNNKLSVFLLISLFTISIGRAQSSSYCDSLAKIAQSKIVKKTNKTNLKSSNGKNPDINITIDNSHSANNTNTLPNNTNESKKQYDILYVLDYCIKALLLLIGIYIAFIKSYFTEKGKNLATLEDISKITDKVESVKLEYNSKIEEYKAKLGEELAIKVEPLKAILQKDNISYQIGLAELTRNRFLKVEELISSLVELQNYIKVNMFIAKDDEDFARIKKEFNEYYNKVDTLRKICDLYISDDLTNKVIDALNNAHSAFLAFAKIFHTNPDKLGDISPYDYDAQQIRLRLATENISAFDKLNTVIVDFPKVLKDLTTELKKEITIKKLDSN